MGGNGMRPAGFILAGGRSVRMGTDKACLPIAGTTLLQHVLNVMRQVAGPVTVVGRVCEDAPSIPDDNAGLGPLGGIATALARTESEWNLVAACDMPALTADLLSQIIGAAERTDLACVVTATPDGRWHPLCAAYRRSCLPAVDAALQARKLKVVQLVASLRPEIVAVADPEMLRNVNTPEEWREFASAG